MELGRVISRVAGIFLCAIISLHAQNLLLNGNFEDDGGSFANWSIAHSPPEPPYSSPIIASNNESVGYFAQFTFEPNCGDILSQTIATIPGMVYDIAFSAEDGDGHNFETEFSFGDFSADLAPTFETGAGESFNGWTNFNFTVTANSTETELSFTIYADTGSEFGADNVSVTPAPEPSEIILAVLTAASMKLRRTSNLF
jgi:hypothetical protein